jgi:hypothetical protein
MFNQNELIEFLLRASEEDVIKYVRLETIVSNYLHEIQYLDQIINFKIKYEL